MPASLKRLRVLVTVLTLVMIGGVITITALLVIRLSAGGTERVVNPGDFTLPEDVGIVGFSAFDGRTIVIGDDGIIRVFDSGTQELQRSFPVVP